MFSSFDTACTRAPDHKIYSADHSLKEGENRWIVITTIFAPTDCIKYLSTIPDWNLVIIGDKKTPSPWTKDWKIPPNVHYLSPEDQEKLPFSMVSPLPWANYARKNLGFLYAISKGATVIYETDDDNCPEEPRIVYLPEYSTDVHQVITSEPTENAYAHFGQPTVWQRGIPLEDIKRETLKHRTSPAVTKAFVPFQQALADHDPDVDAMFRLTRALPIYFDKSSPHIVLPTGTMSPTNSQNTVSHRSAFWATLLPLSPSPRVTDIWRGYWNQVS